MKLNAAERVAARQPELEIKVRGVKKIAHDHRLPCFAEIKEAHVRPKPLPLCTEPSLRPTFPWIGQRVSSTYGFVSDPFGFRYS